MKLAPRHWQPGLLASLLSMFALLVGSLTTRAASRYWIDSAGGNFDAASSWASSSGGAGGASVPASSDIANFDINSTYTVDFPVSATTTNSACDVEFGTVTWDLLFGEYLLTSSGALDIGNVSGQTGRLTVVRGGVGVDTNGDNIIVGSPGTGYLTVGYQGHVGVGATKPDLFLGSSATGIATVEDDGRMDIWEMRLGNAEQGNGTLTVTGPAAVVTTAQVTTVGNLGTGTLRVFNGANFFAGAAFTAASGAGSTGSVVVSGTGSRLEISSSNNIGSGGTGSLSINSGGVVDTVGTTIIGGGIAGVGTATLNGSTSRWIIAGGVDIAADGNGSLTASGGAQLETGTTVRLGRDTGSEGRATVSGAGSRWSSAGAISVGVSGSGELKASSGGVIAVGQGLDIAGSPTGSGVVTVSGAGSTLSTDTGLRVAVNGEGTLNVDSEAEVYVGTTLLNNDPVGSALGTLNLEGGSIYVGGDFTNDALFNFTDGLLQVRGTFQPQDTPVGFTLDGVTQDDLPTLDLVGNGAVSNITNLIVGDIRRGQLLLRESRTVDLGGNSLYIGQRAGSEGTVTVESGATVLAGNILAVGGGSGPGGTGILNIRNGTVDVGDLRLYPGGVINLEGGTLIVDSVGIFDGQFNWTGGTFAFDGDAALDAAITSTLTGPDRALDSGQVLSTKSPVQILTVNQPLTLDGGELQPGVLRNNSVLVIRAGGVVASRLIENAGTILLSSPLASLTGFQDIVNSGTIRGTGVLNGVIQNDVPGRILVNDGEDLLITSTLKNSAAIDVIGGSLRAQSDSSTAASTGIITARNAQLSFDNLHTNNGSLVVSGGVNDIFGDVLNSATGSIVVSGGATAIFYDDVANNGTFNVSASGPLSSTAVFFGELTGNGIAGAGSVFIEGDARPGASPATMAYGGQVSFGPSATLHAEIGGTVPGTDYDRLVVSGDLFLAGTLEVSLIDGFVPAAGMSFDLWDAGSAGGAFHSIQLPDLPAGLYWHTGTVNVDGTLSVSVTPQSYAEFAALYSLSTAPTGDQDRDGLANLLEYALGLHPLVQNFADPGTPRFSRSGSDDLFTFDMPVIIPPDLELQIQSGTDLIGWEVLATRSAGDPWTGLLLPELVPTDPGWETVTLTRTGKGEPMRFYRILVRLVP